METVIQTLSELQALKKYKTRHGARQIVLELPGDLDEVRKVEGEINKSLRACGCETAAVFLLIGLVAIVPFFLLGHYDWAAPRLLVGIFAFLGMLTLAGKVTGLVIAEWRLRSAIARFETETVHYGSPGTLAQKPANLR